MMEHFPFNTHQTLRLKKKEGQKKPKRECKLVILKQIVLHLIIFSTPPDAGVLP